jgi:uncharacterized ferritin-like protein (DUF455 family)
MNYYSDFARKILEGTDLNSKLTDFSFDWNEWQAYELPEYPGRAGKLGFTDKVNKFPKVARLNEDDKKAAAIHSFANHELLAIEMMAAALLIYPHRNEEEIRFKKGILTALKDEQKHLQMYIKRINELGYAFGDFPLNDFFWRQMPKLKTPESYLSLMALTFEAANLDFAQYYSGIFKNLGDTKTSAILDEVLEDEISHVAFGAFWMKKWRQDKSLWDYYRECLPWPLTPARGRGINFDTKIHMRAMNDEEFVQNLVKYDDDFIVTKRYGYEAPKG